jgi:hypothetical protein
VQIDADPAMRGRVLALLSVVFLGSTPIGGPIIGWVSEVLDPRAGVLVGGIAAAAAVAWTVRQMRRFDTADRLAEPVESERAAEGAVRAA